MKVHANAALGPAGRLALVKAIESGMTQKAAAAAFSVRPPQPTAGGIAGCRRARKRRSGAGCWTAPRGPTAARGCSTPSQEPICECAAQTGWGPRLVAGGSAATTRPSGRSSPATALAAAEGGAGADRRYEWPCPGDLLHMDIARYARFERPGHAVTGDRSSARAVDDPTTRVGYDYCTRSSTTTRAWPTSSSTPTSGRHRRRLRRAGARLLRRPRRSAPRRLMTDNAFAYVKNRSLRELLAADRGPAHHHPALPAPHQRQGRALQPDDGARVGLRPGLPLPPPSRPRPATLAPPLQPTQAPQLTRRPAADQPRSQRPWVGQLAGLGRSRLVALEEVEQQPLDLSGASANGQWPLAGSTWTSAEGNASRWRSA